MFQYNEQLLIDRIKSCNTSRNKYQVYLCGQRVWFKDGNSEWRSVGAAKGALTSKFQYSIGKIVANDNGLANPSNQQMTEAWQAYITWLMETNKLEFRRT